MIDCLVVGAGQYGLTCAQHLEAAGFSYLVVDECARIGDVWRNRPRNLHLFTSRQFCQLGDVPMPGEPGCFPSAAEFADYLERFAGTGAFKVQLNCKVVAVQREGQAFAVTLEHGEQIRARTIINATGSNQVALIPPLARQLSHDVRQLTAASYRDRSSVDTAGTVLVVGDGASGRQIAYELAGTRKVVMSMGRKRNLVPNVVLGRDIFWWLDKIGVLYAPTGSLVANILRKRNPIPGKATNNARLRQVGVVLKPRTRDAKGDRVFFCDGSSEQIKTVIWCSGYKEDLSWIKLPAIETHDEHIQHRRGKTAQPGFFVIGRNWLSCRASELIMGAAVDAKIVIAHVAEQLGPSSTASGPGKSS